MNKILLSSVVFTISATLPLCVSAATKVMYSEVRHDAIPRGATHVQVVDVVLTASCDADLIRPELTVSLQGLIDAQDIDSVYAMQGYRRVSNAARFSGSDRTAHLRLRRLSIPACKSASFSIAVDMSNSAASGGQFTLSILGDDFFTSISAQPREVASSSSGKIDAEIVPISGRIRIVSEDTLAKIRLTAKEKNQIVKSITFENTGSAKGDDARNLYLRSSRNRRLSERVQELNKREVTLVFSPPLYISEGASLRLDLRGNAYTRSRTFSFRIQDIWAESVRGRQ